MSRSDDGSIRMTLRMPDELKGRLEQLAASSGVPVSTLSRQLIERAIDTNGLDGDDDAMADLVRAQADLARAQARHVTAQARRVELENERIEHGFTPMDADSSGISLVVISSDDTRQLMNSRPIFGTEPGQLPYRQLPEKH